MDTRAALAVSVMVHVWESTEVTARVRREEGGHAWYVAVRIEGAGSTHATMFLGRAEIVRLGEVLSTALVELDAKECADADGAPVASPAA